MASCLIVIDVQESFRHRPCFDERSLPAYMAAQNALIEGFAAAGAPIVRVFHSDGPAVASNSFALESGHVRPLEGLAPFEAAATFTKRRHSALVGTGLDVWLTQNHIERLVVSGIRTEQCCETTARHASDLGWQVDYVTEATLTFDMVQPDGRPLSAADIRARTARRPLRQGVQRRRGAGPSRGIETMSGAADTLRVAILAFDDAEALDLAGPYEVFTTAVRMHQRDAAGAPPPFEVQCVARSREPVRPRAGLQVLPDRSFDDACAVDLLIVPGGVVDAAMACSATLDWIARASREARISAPVCTGAFLLAAGGALQDGESVTTHWEDIDELRSRFPSLDVREGVRWVDQGRA